MTELITASGDIRHMIAEGFRAMMRGFPTGVSIVTATDVSGTPRGMTCTSVSSVTLHPPTLLVCLRDGSPTLEAVVSSGTFSVNLLHSAAQSAAELFASGAPNRFDLIYWERSSVSGSPRLSRDAHAIAECRVNHTATVGDHTVVFGETLSVTRHSGLEPLLYGLGQYRFWPEMEADGTTCNQNVHDCELSNRTIE